MATIIKNWHEKYLIAESINKNNEVKGSKIMINDIINHSQKKLTWLDENFDKTSEEMPENIHTYYQMLDNILQEMRIFQDNIEIEEKARNYLLTSEEVDQLTTRCDKFYQLADECYDHCKESNQKNSALSMPSKVTLARFSLGREFKKHAKQIRFFLQVRENIEKERI